MFIWVLMRARIPDRKKIGNRERVRGQRLRGASELRLRLRTQRLPERGDKREYSHIIEKKESKAQWQTLRSAAVFPLALSSGVSPF